MNRNSNKFKSNSRRPKSKGFKPDKEDVSNSKGYFGDAINDIKWYRDNEQMLNDVSRIAYNIPVGMPFSRNGMVGNSSDWSIPGLVAMDVVPTYGPCNSPSDPVNVAFHGMFTYIRSRVSGTNFTWDASTLGINMLATDSIYAMAKWYTRLYATLPLFHASNKYLCRYLIEAQGVDYDDFLANSAKFRAEFNMRLARINALKIPSEIYVFARHEWLFENYYIEGASTKDQIYFYRPAAYYIHTLDANGVPYLKCHRTLAGGTGVNGKLTASDLIRKLDAMLDPIYNDQYFNLISGFIERAYEGKVMSISYLPDQMIVPLVYSEEVLLQFKNAKPYPVKHASSGAGYEDGSFDLTQGATSATDPRIILHSSVSGNALRCYRCIDDNTITYVDNSSTTAEKWNMYMVANELSKEVLLTSPHADVVPAENMINTRLIPTITAATGDTGAPSFSLMEKAWGTEWPIEIEVFTRYYDHLTHTYGMSDVKLHNIMYHDTTGVNAANLVTHVLPMISVFKYLPELRLVARNGAGDSDVWPNFIPFFEIDNYALVDHDDIAMLHDSAAMAMLRVPEIASSNLNAR